MKEKITAIVLGSIRHSDRHNVCTVFTRERGRMALLTPAGGAKRSRQAASRLLPLSVVEAQVNIGAGRELSIPSAIAPMEVWRSLYCDPVKTAVTLFTAEFLGHLLREAAPEPKVWDFIKSSTAYFDLLTDRNAIANFHIAFLIGMSHLMGIFPDVAGYTDGMEFDMSAGRMVLPFSGSTPRNSRIDSRWASYIPKILRMNYSNAAKFRFSGRERNEVLSLMVRYFGVHYPGADNLKSLAVLTEIFS